MTRTVETLTPQALLEAPRRSAGVPNADASRVLFTKSAYNFAEHAWNNKELHYLNTSSNEIHLILEDKHLGGAVWLDPHDSIILVFRGTDDGETELLKCDVSDFENTKESIATVPGSISEVKITSLGAGKFGIAFAAPANPDGSMYNPKVAPKPHSTGRLYRSLYVRHWDTYVTPQRSAIFYSCLELSESRSLSVSAPFINALEGTGIESPIPPFGGADNFDISPNGLILVARDPTVDQAYTTKCNLYIVPLSTFCETELEIFQIPVPGFEGALTSPVFSPDGRKAAFLAMREDGYESDRNHIFTIKDVSKPAKLTHHLYDSTDGDTWWKMPSAIMFNADGSSLFVKAEDTGRVLVHALPINTVKNRSDPIPLTADGSVTSMTPLQNGDLFTTRTSLVANYYFTVIHLKTGLDSTEDHTFTTEELYSSESLFALSRSSVREMWSPAAGDESERPKQGQVHSWIFLPPGFDESKKYPLAFLVHGGPQGAWTDSWSTRWNPAVFAAQGYVVVTPNPTGSTGYGKPFVDAIQGRWGDLPYEDLVNAFKYIKKNISYVDTSRAVAGGASYGGYMTNWIQGHDLGREFKALFCHDGVFSTLYQMAGDEMYFPNREYEGTWTENPKGWRDWDPSAHVAKWKTPQLVIHSDKDYRLTMADGIAAFNSLKEQGVESAFLNFPDENHWVLNPENSLKWHHAIFAFCNPKVGLEVHGVDDLKEIIMDPEVDAKPHGSDKRRIKVLSARESEA